jgi:hypothetical protein
MTSQNEIGNIILANATKKHPQKVIIKHRRGIFDVQVPSEVIHKSEKLPLKNNESIIIYGDSKDFNKEKLCIEVVPDSELWFQIDEIPHPNSKNKKAWQLTIKMDNYSRPRDVNVTVGDPE